MKKFLGLALALVLACGLVGCGSGGDNGGSTDSADNSSSTDSADNSSDSSTDSADNSSDNADVTAESAASVHKIGVLVYDRTYDEVIAFKDYLEGYIEICFDDVDFLYSDSISTADEALAFIDTAEENGVEGIMSFNSFDLEAEVEKCAGYGMYYMMASGSVSDEEFDKVAENEYFLGVVGPGSDVEYDAGYSMGEYFASETDSDAYLILSGGASIGNEMHLQRTVGMLDALGEEYGVTYEQDTQELAKSAEVTEVQAGDLNICIAPGYLNFEEYRTAAEEALSAGDYGAVLAAMAVSDMQQAITDSGAKYGVVDCYSDTNWELFRNGELDYLTGKYRSIIGPSFAAMYNAVSGYAADFRESDGKAFHVAQGFWTSSSLEDFEEKYELSSSLEINAYNYEDLYSVCKNYSPDAALEDLKALAGAYSYEEAQSRREQ